VLNLDVERTVGEWKEFKRVVKDTPALGMKMTHKLLGRYLERSDNYPNLKDLYHISQTIFVSTAGAERYLSQLKLVKTDHSNRMSDDLLCAILRCRTYRGDVNELIPDAIKHFKAVVTRDICTSGKFVHDF